MKSIYDYHFHAIVRNRHYICEVTQGPKVAITGYGYIDDREYEAVRKYIEDEGFLIEADDRKGITAHYKTCLDNS